MTTDYGEEEQQLNIIEIAQKLAVALLFSH
jgi:hypothetical protein